MVDWIALSGDPHPVLATGEGLLLDRGALVVELAPGLGRPAEVLSHLTPLSRVSLIVDPARGLSLGHAQGRVARVHRLPGPLATDAGLRVTFAWDAPGRRWSLACENLRDGMVRRAFGADPVALPADDAWAVCAGGAGRAHPLLVWAGVRRLRPAVPAGALLLAAAVPVLTVDGHRAAGDLVAGDALEGHDGRPLFLRACMLFDQPHRGTLAPIRLRAGHFPLHRDVTVGPRTVLRMADEAVEYLFGTRSALVRAADLGDPVIAHRLHDGRSTAMVALVTDRAGAVMSDRLGIWSGPAPEVRRPYEAAALIASRRTGPLRAA